MWHYFWGHNAYHLLRPMSLQSRKYLLIPVLIILSIISAGLQLYVISIRDWYIMHCPFPLTTLMLTSIVYTIFMLGFVVVFCISKEVKSIVKILFHAFGMADAVYGIVYIHYVYKAYVCALATVEVYFACSVISFLTIISFVFFMVLTPFWIWEWYQPNKSWRMDFIPPQVCGRDISALRASSCLKPIV